jgi:hypothetical protein
MNKVFIVTMVDNKAYIDSGYSQYRDAEIRCAELNESKEFQHVFGIHEVDIE